MADPVGVTGCLAWWSANDPATLTDAGSGHISAMTDKSGNGITLLQGTDANRPITGTRTMNGHNGLDFNGSSMYMAATVSANYFLPPVTIYTAFLLDAADSNDDYLLWNGIAGSTQQWALLAADDGSAHYARLYGDASNIISYPTPVTPDATNGYYTAFADGASSEIRYNQVSHITGDIGTGSGTGTTIELGRYGATGTSFLNGIWGESLIYSGHHSAPNRALVETYLDGVFVTTPAGIGSFLLRNPYYRRLPNLVR